MRTRLSPRLRPDYVGLALLPLARNKGLSPDTAAQLWPVLTAFPCLLIGRVRLAPDVYHAKELAFLLGPGGKHVNPLAKKSRSDLNRRMRNLHAWTHRTEEGEKREVRAVKTRGRWRLQSKLKHDEEWTYHEVPVRSDLEELRDILWRKYQRRRASHEDVLLADRMLSESADS